MVAVKEKDEAAVATGVDVVATGFPPRFILRTVGRNELPMDGRRTFFLAVVVLVVVLPPALFSCPDKRRSFFWRAATGVGVGVVISAASSSDSVKSMAALELGAAMVVTSHPTTMLE